MRRRVWTLGLAALGAWSLAVAQAEVSFKKDVQPIINRECVDCHGPKRQKGGLDLSPDKAYAAVVGVASREMPTMSLVKVGNPDQSYLMLKLEHRSAEGSGMPKGFFGAKKLPQAEIALIRKWIESGAKP